MAGASDTVDTGRGHERVRGYRRTENEATTLCTPTRKGAHVCAGCGTAIRFKTVHVIGEQQIRARGIRRTKYDTTFHFGLVYCCFYNMAR